MKAIRIHASAPGAQPVDPRLREAVAAALCWAEFARPDWRPVSETPASYWAGVPQENREKYYLDAESFALAMRSGAPLRLVQTTPTQAMIDAARSAGAGIRTDAAVIRVWNAMLAARLAADRDANP